MGIIAIEFPTRYASGPADYIAKGLAARDRYQDEPLINFALAPHAPYTVSDDTFRQVATLAEELDVPIHCHVHETRDEVERSVAEHGVRPIARLHRLGLVSPRLMAVHSIHLTNQECELLAREGASVVHCPSSNLKLAAGFAPVAGLARAGVNLALGTDGAASNNRLDVFAEMRLAALLAKGVSGDASALPGHAALHAATLGGARALGLDSAIGAIIPGRYADLTAVRLTGLALQPCYDPVSHLVYACSRSDVSHVWVAGRPRVIDGVLDGAPFDRLENRICMWQNRLVS